MKAITLLQPWASLIAQYGKLIETRSWSSDHRGPLAIHAGKKRSGRAGNPHPIGIDLLPYGLRYSTLPYGCVVAVAELVDIERIECGCFSCVRRLRRRGTDDDVEAELRHGDFTAGRYAWILSSVKTIDPVPAKGALGLWEWEPTMADSVV